MTVENNFAASATLTQNCFDMISFIAAKQQNAMKSTGGVLPVNLKMTEKELCRNLMYYLMGFS